MRLWRCTQRWIMLAFLCALIVRFPHVAAVSAKEPTLVAPDPHVSLPPIQPETTVDQPAVESRPGVMLTLEATGKNSFTRVAPAPRRPSAVNTATFTVNYIGTWDASAKTAFQYAVDQWATQIYSPVPIIIDATWADLGPTTLGSAGATTAKINFTNAPVANTWYSIALANSRAGYDLAPTQSDITANFNSTFGSWYFGTDGLTPAGKYDFVSVVMHEIGHGLGFSGSATVSSGSGSWGSSGYPYIYDRFTENSAGTTTLSYTSPSAALATYLQSDDLYFDGTNANAANGGTRPRLYAPATWQQGSSYSHLNESTYPAGNANSLMTPQLGTAEAIQSPGPITMGIFKDLGWLTTGSAGQTGSNFVVNVLGDSPADAGCTVADCTLREATTAANVSSDASTITFSVAGTVTLTQGELSVTTPITMSATTNTLTVSGNNTSRIATIYSGATLALVGMKFMNGNSGSNSGGAIQNAGTLKLVQTTLSGNSAANGGAIITFSNSITTLQQSTISGNTATSGVGGGIFNQATLTIQQSTISGNTATNNDGGGIYHYIGTLTIRQSTINGNVAAVDSFGGGLLSYYGATLTIQQSTINGNSAGIGGGIANFSSTTIDQSTISGNTAIIFYGGVTNDSSLTIGRTIVVGNTDPDGSYDLLQNAGSMSSQGYNLIGVTNGTFGSTGDQTNRTSAQLNLGSLQNNGGPTSTMLPQTGSIAINAGLATSSYETDQRGYVRVVGGNVDIGAVEANAPTAVTLVQFAGEHSPSGIVVRWMIGQHDDVTAYVLERQTLDGWDTVGEVVATPINSYQLTDAASATQTHVYRLSARNSQGELTLLGETTVLAQTLVYLPMIHN